jgi:C-terminal processing protease CtpA/Prc
MSGGITFSMIPARFVSAALILVAPLGSSTYAQLPNEPPHEDTQVARICAVLLPKGHISRHPLDVEISRRTFDGFLRRLDPDRIYFLASDVEQFARRRDTLAQDMHRGKLDFFYSVYRVYLERLGERARDVADVGGGGLDPLDTAADPPARAPSSRAEARERLRRVLRNKAALLMRSGSSAESARKKLKQEYAESVEKARSVDSQRLLEMILTSLTQSFDPGSHYISKSTMAKLREAKEEGTLAEYPPLARAVIEYTPEGGESRLQIGVVALPQFHLADIPQAGVPQPASARSATGDLSKVLDEFRREEVDAVVLNLRGNTGGALTEVASVCGLFLDRGCAVRLKSGDGKVSAFNIGSAEKRWDGPLVVLVDSETTSGAEALAAALQDHGRALIVGDATTPGRGGVASLVALGPMLFRIKDPPELGALHVTMSGMYRADGRSIQGNGVRPDIELPGHDESSREAHPYEMKPDRIDPLPIEQPRALSAESIGRLRSRSSARREKASPADPQGRRQEILSITADLIAELE